MINRMFKKVNTYKIKIVGKHLSYKIIWNKFKDWKIFNFNQMKIKLNYKNIL